ncbi:MAG: thiolase family protein [Dehalococcoidia bacterium]|mgnify:FL=1|nr:thiolase family protein [Dehalococcoidia bacterium]|tara:strand:+ start:124 stop:1269 length:1146 start_codon:yes stop_codon:yes gene_type:complete
MKNLRNRYCIVGVGNTAYGKNPGVSQVAHNILAIRSALEDAGLEAKQLDGILTKAPTSTFPMLWGPKIAEALRVQPKVTGTIDQAGASNIGLIQYAVSAIELGQAEYIAISYGDNPRTGTRASYARPRGEDALAGLFGAPSSYAMVAKRHMYEYGTTPEQLANVAIAHRTHASMNPGAQFQELFTLEEYLASRWVAEPFRLLDCCPVSDGGAAYIITTEKNAKELNKDPIYIEGIGQGHPSWDFFRRPELATSGAAVAGKMAFDSAQMTTDDVDFCEIYDCFTIVPLISLEEYGFVKKGEGGSFYEEKRTHIGGELPCNTSGGLLSETGMPGTQLVVEAVRQLRGECENRQVEGAEVGLVSQQGGIMTTHATMLLSNIGAN